MNNHVHPDQENSKKGILANENQELNIQIDTKQNPKIGTNVEVNTHNTIVVNENQEQSIQTDTIEVPKIGTPIEINTYNTTVQQNNKTPDNKIPKIDLIMNNQTYQNQGNSKKGILAKKNQETSIQIDTKQEPKIGNPVETITYNTTVQQKLEDVTSIPSIENMKKPKVKLFHDKKK